VAKFRIATPAGASFTVAGADYGYEMEALTPIDAEIFEIPPKQVARDLTRDGVFFWDVGCGDQACRENRN
jgi:hypothetical protein